MATPTIIPKSTYYDGTVTEIDRAEGRAGAPDFTVYGQDQLKLRAHPTKPFTLIVSKGKASAFGVTAYVEGSNESELEVAFDPNTSGTRWDLVRIRYNWQPNQGGPSDIRVSNAGGKQIPQSVVNIPGVVVDQPLWLVRWEGNASAPAEYVDLRCFAGNGGLSANDTLALGYLAKPGADVRIGDYSWRYKEQSNFQYGWSSYYLRAPIVTVEGAGPTAPIIKAGTVSVNSDGNGAAAYVFERPFPSSIFSATINQASQPVTGVTAYGPVTLRYSEIDSNRRRVAFFVYNTSGQLVKNLPNLRVTFMAVGD